MNLLASFLVSLTVIFSSVAYGQNIHEPLPCMDKTFGIIVHIIQDYNGDAGITEAEVQGKLDTINDIFDSICIQFEICEFRYIPNFQYNNMSDNEFPLMDVAYNESNRINLYFAQSTASNPGFSTFYGINLLDAGGIVAIKDGPAEDVAHLFGHYFGLSDTWEGSQSANPELVDGSNCATAGDSICDTPADPFTPFLLIAWQNQFFLDFIFEGTDANGSYFNPLVGNIMSNYRERCFFTYGQYRKMADVWLNSGMQMW